MKVNFRGGKVLMLKAFIVLLLCVMQLPLSAQIGVLTNSPDASAELDIVASTKGLLIPRIVLSSSLSDPSPVSSPAEGLLVFNSGGVQLQGFYYWEGTKWVLIKTPNAQEVLGPSSTTDNAIVRFDGTTGKIIQNSGAIINDANQISQLNNIDVDGFQLTASPINNKILISDVSGNASWGTAPPIDVNYNYGLVTANVWDLNFEGGTKVKDAGNNEAQIIFYTNNVTKDVIQVSSTSSTDLNDLAGVVAIPWDVEEEKDASTFTHSNSSLPERITVSTSGIYELNYMFSALNQTVMRKTLRTRIRKNGVSFFNHITSYSFSYQDADFEISHSSSSFLIELQANDYVELVVNGRTNPGAIVLIPNENFFFLRLIREL